MSDNQQQGKVLSGLQILGLRITQLSGYKDGH